MWKYILPVSLVLVVPASLGQCQPPSASPVAGAGRPAAAAPTAAAIKVELQMVEMQINKLANTDSWRYGGSRGTSVLELLRKLYFGNSRRGNRGIAPSSDARLIALLEALRRDGFAEVLAEPSLTVASGRAATLNAAGNPAGPPGYFPGKAKETGTRADVRADFAANDRIHVDFRLRVCQPDLSGPIAGIPPLKERAIESGLELRSGQTAVLGRLVAPRNSNNGEMVIMFVLVRAEIVTNDTAARTTTSR
jgi:Flp pilus assembly secretin CpaC